MVVRWLVVSLLGFSAVACSGDDGEACSPANEVDDTDVASAAQALSPGDQRAIARAVTRLSGAPGELAARAWSEAKGSSEGALVRDFVESAWIDRDPEVASRLVADAAIAVDRGAIIANERGASYTALRRVVVSGDLVDAFHRDDEQVAFAIGDVSGKGVPAGLLRAFVRPILRQVTALSGSPGETLTHLNRILCGARLDALYVTLFLGWLDRRTGSIAFANAGHPPPIQVGAGGARATGHPTGPILGILEARTYDTGGYRRAGPAYERAKRGSRSWSTGAPDRR